MKRVSKDNNKKTPKVRFPGFNDDWEEKKCKDIAPLQRGFDLPVSNMIEGKYPVVMSNGIGGYHNEYKVKGPGVITGRSGTIGKLQYIDTDYWPHNTSLWVTDFKGNYPKFVFYLYQKLNLSKFGTGSGVPTLNRNDVHDTLIHIPSHDEQKKISMCLDNLDHLITLHQRKLEKLKEYKKGMLQKMFPKNGEKVPEIRFPGFDGEWEERKVSELCSVSTGKSNTQDKVEDGKYPFYVRSPIIERSTKYLYDEEAVITVGDGVGTGKVFHYVNGKYDLHQRCYRMYGFSDELNAHYFYHTFSKLFYKRVMAMTAKTSVDSVRLEMISDMKIPVPDIEEQRKIGSFLDNLDRLITLQQKKIESLKEFKKGCLQQMFV